MDKQERPVFLAMDYGAGSGRGIAGTLEDGYLEMQEIDRMSNDFVRVGDECYWDIFRLYQFICSCMEMTYVRFPDASARYVGVDTWGTDYGFLDKRGQPLGGCRCNRGGDKAGKAEVEQLLTRERLFKETGIQCTEGNTLYQLYTRKLQDDPVMPMADCMLMLPDLMKYYLTGEKSIEYTQATTSMMLRPGTLEWHKDLLKELGLRTDFLPPVILPGKTVYPVDPRVTEGAGTWQYAQTAGHDTGCAVAAAPIEPDEMFCSTGSWFMTGTEIDHPIVSDQAMADNFANEGTPDGRIRLLKNGAGMWSVSECVKEWKREGCWCGWDELVSQAWQARPFVAVIDLEQRDFYSAGKMREKIRSWCQKTGQEAPQTMGEIARCLFESIVLGVRYNADALRRTCPKPYQAMRMFGGAVNNALICQMMADALDMKVYAGLPEASCVGNLLIQALAAGYVKDIEEVRRISRSSFPQTMYAPQASEPGSWAKAYDRYCDLKRQTGRI